MADSSIFSHNLRAKIIMLKGATGSKGADGGTFNDPGHYVSSIAVKYVDCQNGDDSAAGTSAAPLKTLDAALNLLNTNSTALSIHLKTAGTYTIEKTHINAAWLRIIGDDENIVVAFSGNYPEIYNSYLSLENVQVTTLVAGAAWSSFNSVVRITNGTYAACRIISYGGSLWVQNSTINQIYLQFSNLVLNNITVDGRGKTTGAIRLSGCNGGISGTLTLEDLAEATTAALFYLADSELAFDLSVVNHLESNFYARAFQTYRSTIFVSNATSTELRSAANNNDAKTMTITVEGSSVLGG